MRFHDLGFRTARRSGVTLVEMLVALAIFGVVLSLAYGGILNALRVQADQEFVTTSQARLRRVVEVVTQDIRSAVFGSITGSPYTSTEDSVSFMLLSGAAGFPVENQSTFSQATTNVIIARTPEANALNGSQVVIVNSNQEGAVFQIGSVTSLGNNRFRLNNSTCRNTIEWSSGVQLFEVARLGLRFDRDDRTIYQTLDSGAEMPLAFEIDDFRLEYVYTTGAASATQPTIVRTTPFMVGTSPTRRHVDSNGFTYILNRINLVISSNENVRGRQIERTYSGFVDLSSNAHFTLMEVLPCGS